MEFIIREIKNRIGYVKLNRPEKRNALNFAIVTELKTVLRELESDPDVKIIVLQGMGENFCAGADLKYLQEMQSNSFEDNLNDSNQLKELYYLIYSLKKVVIAKVEGYAIAGGAGLASVCDFIFASPSAVFGYSEVKIGFVPAIVMTFLIRKIGEANARLLLLSGNRISAAEAQNIGLVNFVTGADDLDQKVENFAEMLVEENSEQSMALTKQMIGAIQSKDLSSALNYAAEKNARARSFSDCQKGISAFLQKKKIVW